MGRHALEDVLMLLLIAFACFIALFTVWLILPNVSESRHVRSAAVHPAPETGKDSTAMPVRA